MYSVKMRKPGDWFVSQPGVSVKEGGCLAGSYGNGVTPQDAVQNHWKVLVEDIDQSEKYLVLLPLGGQRRAVKWAGFMWIDINEEYLP
jgi:hypothetical protein